MGGGGGCVSQEPGPNTVNDRISAAAQLSAAARINASLVP